MHGEKIKKIIFNCSSSCRLMLRIQLAYKQNHTGTPQQLAFSTQFAQLIILSLQRKHSIPIFVITSTILTTDKGKLGGKAACGNIAFIKIMKTARP